MELNELLKNVWLIQEEVNIRNNDKTRNELLLLKLAKIPEEVWELHNEVLKKIWFVRKEKSCLNNDLELSLEFADVIISALSVAYELNVDIDKALETKINILFERFNVKK